MPKILIAEPAGFSTAAVKILKDVAEVDLIEIGKSDLPNALATYDALWIRLGFRLSRDLLVGSTACRLIACAVTGLDHIDLKATTELGIKVISLRGEADFLREIRSTAELTIGMAIALARNIPGAFEHVKAGGWQRDRFRGRELYGKTAGVLGLGRLGTIVAGYLYALGMRIVGFDPYSEGPSFVDQKPELAEVLGASDLITVHVAYTEGNHHLLSESEFSHMKPGAILINTSRGGLINESTLLAALEEQHLAGAALDVIQNEDRVDSQNPLVEYARTHDNLLILPHIGGNCCEAFEKTECFLAHKVAAELRSWKPR